MDINNLTIRQVKEIGSLLSKEPSQNSNDLCDQIGEYVIVRTYSAGVHAGILKAKSGSEVYLKDSRRLWSWKAKKSISLSGVAMYGINQKQSKIAPVVELQWLDAIEILSTTDVAQKSIVEAEEQCQN